jgi:mannose-6-phosphate isomerase-like protein (cupin superfamily)
MDVVSINEKFGLFHEHWRPKIVASLNGQEIKLVKVQGEFPWHAHDHIEEMFLVWKGVFQVEFRNHTATLRPGEFIVVPRGVEHRTLAADEAEVLIFEPKNVRNTGDVVDPFYTAPMDEEI